MENAYERFYINEAMSVYDAAKVIDKNASKTAFLIKNGTLQGAVSDGDIRRFFLNQGDGNKSVKEIVNYSPIFLKKDSEVKNYEEFMIQHAIMALPIVDDENRIIKIELLNSEQPVHKIEKEIPVIVMAGGRGTRLKPYTDIIPKPLIPIGEKTITEHIMDQYIKYGCRQFFLIVNYKKNLIKTYFKETPLSIKLKFVDEEEFLGTAGGLKLLPKEILNNFFVTNCDIVVNADYHNIYNKHLIDKNIITMVTAKKKLTIPYGTVNTNQDGIVVSMTEKPSISYKINTGMYVCQKKILSYIKQGEKIDMPSLIERCIKEGERVGTYQVDRDEWMDMGQFDELENMKNKLKG